MQDAIVEPMPTNSFVAGNRDSKEGLFQVVIVEMDEKGDAIQNSPNNIVYRTDLSYDQAISVANQFVEELRKAREENQK
jgi:hypothetical protein